MKIKRKMKTEMYFKNETNSSHILYYREKNKRK